MIDHANIPVSDLDKSRRFYTAVLAELGYKPIAEDVDALGFGDTWWSFGIEKCSTSFSQLHVAFKAPSRVAVDAFFETAVSSGATSNGAPGPRPQYADGYYAAFVLDPDGHNIEAVFKG